MQYFHLYPDKESDQILAHVIVFDDGQTIIKWCGNIKSLTIHQNLDEFKSISVTGSRYLYLSY
jgi:hypothetical protein